jgi:hypothetical protein
MHHIKPIASLTADELRAAGALAADAGEEIMEAGNRRELTGLSLLYFEEGYFGRNLGRAVPVPEQLSG